MKANFKKNAKNVVCGLLGLVAFLLFLCGCNKDVGTFYSLDEAYENGWLTKDDLKSVAYYYHTRYGELKHMDDSFRPAPKTPEILSEEAQNQIKQAYLNEIINMPDGMIERVMIYNYFGTYQENVVLYISDTYHAYDYVIESEYVIDGICFYDYSSAFLRVWRG